MSLGLSYGFDYASDSFEKAGFRDGNKQVD